MCTNQTKLRSCSLRPSGHNACADQPCSLLCLPQPGHRHTCVCPDGAPTITMPNGELQCQCPSGYQLQNNTCIKTGERKKKKNTCSAEDYCDNVDTVGNEASFFFVFFPHNQSTAVCPTSTAAPTAAASAASGSATATTTAET